MSELTVDEFVNTKVLPEFHPIVAMIRELMRECAPEAQEAISYGIPAYKMQRIIAVISPTKNDIALTWTKQSQNRIFASQILAWRARNQLVRPSPSRVAPSSRIHMA